MKYVCLDFPRDVHSKIWNHLLPGKQYNEEAAFGFVRAVTNHDGIPTFRLVDSYLIGCDGFEYQSSFHLELADKERARVIKRAHDLDASIVEFHSHLSKEEPSFSASDIYGFEETVPHFIWRLKGKPYFAIVVSRAGFDGLAWIESADRPVQLKSLRVEGQTYQATCKTLKYYDTTRTRSM
jgi:hypothetical protein